MLIRETSWGGARVVEWDGLENRCGLRSTEGSNPSLPARKHARGSVFFICPRVPSLRGGYSKLSLLVRWGRKRSDITIEVRTRFDSCMQ